MIHTYICKLMHGHVKDTFMNILLKIYVPQPGSCELIKVFVYIFAYIQVWTERKGVRNLLNLVGKEVKMQGFLLGSYLDRFGDFAKEMESHLKERKINSKLKIVHGIDKFLESLGSLFTSSNIGKVVIQVK